MTEGMMYLLDKIDKERVDNVVSTEKLTPADNSSPMRFSISRYRSGLENFFRIYMPCVDYWMLADNSCTPRVIVADAFRLGDEVHIYNQELFTKIRSYVN